MANQDQVKQMNAVLEKLKTLDIQRLLRESIGEESLVQKGFAQKFDLIMKKAAFAATYGATVDSNVLVNTLNLFQQIGNTLDAQSKRTNADYVSQKPTFLTQIDSQLEQLNGFWPPFVTAAIESRGFLEDEGIRKEYEKTVAEMKSQSAEALAHVREESTKTIEEARKLAQQIEERARRTAAHISVEAAQEEFKNAQKDLDNKVVLWGALSALSIVSFIGVAAYLARVQFPEEWKWHVIYFAAIRITILTAIGAVSTFCLRILRAQMHMGEHNRHRQRVANSMAAFVEAAVTPEQRDIILAQLVNAVVEFGTSGLLTKEDDAVYAPKMTIESITRTIAPLATKQ